MFSPKNCVYNSVWKKEKPGSTITKRLVCRGCGKEIAFGWDEDGEEKVVIHSSFDKLRDEIRDVD